MAKNSVYCALGENVKPHFEDRTRCGFQSVVSYRFGFNGQEMDNEIKGEGNSVTFRYRIHDPRLGRFFSVDPLANKFPWWTPYQFAGNTPIEARELEGLETYHTSVGSEPITKMFSDVPITAPLGENAIEEIGANYISYEENVFVDAGIGEAVVAESETLPLASGYDAGNLPLDEQYKAANTYVDPNTYCFMRSLATYDKIIFEKLGIHPFTDGNGHVITTSDAYNIARSYGNIDKAYTATGVGGALVSLGLAKWVSQDDILSGNAKPGTLIQAWYTDEQSIRTQLDNHVELPTGGHNFIFLGYTQFFGSPAMRVWDSGGIKVYPMNFYPTYIGAFPGSFETKRFYYPLINGGL